PYMMLISLGALQSIPPELYEVARVDGANSWQRFHSITFPLLMISLAPLLIGSFAFNFNNFTVRYLLTGGGPPIPGSQTPAGATDILISYTYKLAFGKAGAQYGYASAISFIIFMIIGSMSTLSFHLTRRLEKMSESL
ncbi:MAG TPA: ABC transporter permease subunit, partial [Thermotogales bacterium]|nr:ABC transporter permease subunit [Thermotogales bacterium]